ncbi:MAG TPA: nuclear transport factor 2 family protein [Arenimonas sp.]|uniref:nuclear transport factor 2 family protein n=1 Tax=Arenimonas sp. TaxID=1872635 RepID=UPI002D1DD5DC|nr:nuclear transport factor 2 family protein [Arenimonas sp.]HMB57291.1 nuclear transport factor 2 family protein [Arenimonas sp.]
MSHDNAELLTRFYTAFAALDAEAMVDCYAPDSVFEDPVFKLRGRNEIGGMWRMLSDATRAKGRDVWSLQFDGISADDASGRAHWEAHYRFSATGRLVHNIIDGQFTFRDGLIVSHRDQFDFPRWARQALGFKGLVLGGTQFLHDKVRAQAAANLQTFLARATR